MELKDFVKQALLDIKAGVDAAQAELGDKALLGSSSQYKIDKLPSNVLQDYSGALYSVVDFDVAVTTSDSVEGGGGINILSLKAGGKVEGRSETASRLQFAITMRI
jgi:hypothetical protein